MNTINRIYLQEDKIGILTNRIDAKEHSHWMLQLFLSLDKELDILVNTKRVVAKCIIIDKNIPHAFQTNHQIHFTCIIEPTSMYANQLSEKMNQEGYYICDTDNISFIQEKGNMLVQDASKGAYIDFMEALNRYLHITDTSYIYDDRILELLELLNTCTCNMHTIASFAAKVSLSSSRLSHIFKEQVGVPLKSYIVLHQIKQTFFFLFDGKTITDAALLAGFDSPSHFATTVKKMMGMSASNSLKDSEFLQVSKY